MTNDISPHHLALTERGSAWIGQFDAGDRELARILLDSLMLVSHSSFERGLIKAITNQAKFIEGPVALFATREWNPTAPYFPEGDDPIDAVDGGSDLGSEARIAAIIRNLCRASSEEFLNHPIISEMRKAQCRAIFVVDDFIGSGERTDEFLSAMWLNRTLRSWKSLGLITFNAIAFSGTVNGQHRVERSAAKPEVHLRRDCPTFLEMPWLPATRRSMLSLIRRYALRTSAPFLALGYGMAAAALVFEHGCPDNCPSILWAPSSAKTSWEPLFPKRSVMLHETSAFPPEMARRDPVLTMIQAGQKRLAASTALKTKGAISRTMLVILGLAAKGIRSKAALSHATGLESDSCARLVEACVDAGLLTPNFRITQAGVAELDAARRTMALPSRVPPLGSDSYYPRQLRGPSHG